VHRPAKRYDHAMAYDSDRKRTVLVGGTQPDPDAGREVQTDTWEWDGTDWIERTPATHPTNHFAGRACYDSGRKRVVLVWGYAAAPDSGVQMETWEWDGDDWLKRQVSGPPGRVATGLAYDVDRQKVVLYGGLAPTSAYSDTWEWDGSAWTEVHPATTPGSHEGVAAYDERRKKVVFFGGYPVIGTWEWDGVDWSEVKSAQTPTEANGNGLAFDIPRHQLVLYGGYYTTDTWFLGQEWLQAHSTSNPPPRGITAMVFDTARNRMVFFGGHVKGEIALNDTWEYQSVERNAVDASGDVTDALADIGRLDADESGETQADADRAFDAASVTDVVDAGAHPRDATSDHHFVPSPDPASCGCRIDARTQPSPWWLLLAVMLGSRSKGHRARVARDHARCVNTSMKLLAGIGTASVRRSPARSASAPRSSMSRKPHSGFPLRRLASKSALLGEVCSPPRLNAP